MRVLLVIVIMFTVSMLFCCMEDNDRYGLNLNEKLHQSKRGIKVRHDLKNLSLLKQKGIWTKLHEHVHHFDGHGTSTEFNISHMKVSCL